MLPEPAGGPCVVCCVTVQVRVPCGHPNINKINFFNQETATDQYALANLTWHGIAVERDRMSDLAKTY